MTLHANDINPAPEILRDQIADLRMEQIHDRALIARLMRYAKEHQDDDHMKRIYATIAAHNLGDGYRPGGALDPYLIPKGN